MKRLGVFFVLSGAAVLSACQSMPGPAVTSVSEHEAVEQVVARYERAVNAGNVDSLLALYAEDAVQAPPNEPALSGIESIGARAADNHAAIRYDLSSQGEHVQVAGNLATYRTNFSETMTSRDDASDQTTTTGVWVLELKRDSQGAWKIITEIWSDDAPLATDIPAMATNE